MGNELTNYCNCIQDKNICNEAYPDQEQPLVSKITSLNQNTHLLKNLPNTNSVGKFFIENPSTKEIAENKLIDKYKLNEENSISKDISTTNTKINNYNGIGKKIYSKNDKNIELNSDIRNNDSPNKENLINTNTNISNQKNSNTKRSYKQSILSQNEQNESMSSNISIENNINKYTNSHYNSSNNMKMHINIQGNIDTNRINNENIDDLYNNENENSNISNISSNNGPQIKLQNGDLYTGGIDSKNLLKGKGKIIYSSTGDIYEGYFDNNLPNGQGKLIEKETGNIYTGSFINGFKDGYGKEIFNDNSIYEGQFKKNKINGNGKLILSNGSVYEGQFEDEKLKGRGKFKWNENKIYDGEWDGNMLCGLGSFIQGNKKFIGYFKNNKKNGFGVNYFYVSNNYLVGTWIDDAIQGVAVFNFYQKGKQIWVMENDKMIRKITEVNKIKEFLNVSDCEQGNRLRKLKEFYEGVIKSEFADDKMILDDELI